MSAAIVDGRVGKGMRSVLAAAVVSLTTRSPPGRTALPVPLNLLDLLISSDERDLMGPRKLTGPRDPMVRRTPTGPPDAGRLRKVTGPLRPTVSPAPLDLPIALGARGPGSHG